MNRDDLIERKNQLEDLIGYIKDIMVDCKDVCDDYGLNQMKIDIIRNELDVIEEQIAKYDKEDKEYLINEYKRGV